LNLLQACFFNAAESCALFREHPLASVMLANGAGDDKKIVFNETSAAEGRNATGPALYTGVIALGIVGVVEIAPGETGLEIPLA
jgi:hypothetical protein